MAVTVFKQFTATIRANSMFTWSMTGCSPGYNRRRANDADPRAIIYWQAVPIITELDIESVGIERENLAIEIVEHSILREGDDLTHQITLACKDVGNLIPNWLRPSRSVLTYALYAVFIDL